MGDIQRNQISNATSVDRYPQIFLEVQEMVGQDTSLDILSFGCSTGQEAFTIHKYFPKANIVGVDVDPDVVEIARKSYGDIADFHASNDYPTGRQFDVVFAMSVLCVYPQSKRRNGLKTLYPFDLYDSTMLHIDTLVKPGGLLVIYNSNYRFIDSSISPWYAARSRDKFEDNGFVPKFSKQSVRMSGFQGSDIIFRKSNQVSARDPSRSNEASLRVD